MTELIVVFTVLVSLAGFYNEALNQRLIFNPYLIKREGQWYRFFTCSLLHADFMHLGVNMYVLYFFGRRVEEAYLAEFGSKSVVMFLLLYVSSVVAANISTYQKNKDFPYYQALGASGGVSAIVFTGILFSPLETIRLFPIPISFPQVVFGIGYLIYSYWMSKRPSNDQVNHDAHFYGSLQGIIFTLAFKPEVGLAFIQQLTP